MMRTYEAANPDRVSVSCSALTRHDIVVFGTIPLLSLRNFTLLTSHCITPSVDVIWSFCAALQLTLDCIQRATSLAWRHEKGNRLPFVVFMCSLVLHILTIFWTADFCCEVFYNDHLTAKYLFSAVFSSTLSKFFLSLKPEHLTILYMKSFFVVKTIKLFKMLRCDRVHWLDVDDRVRFSACVQVLCLHNMAPGYLSSLCQPASSVPGILHLRARMIVVNWTVSVSICPRTVVERLPTSVLQLGTHFLSISKTLIFINHFQMLP